ncbi:PaaI family thioesterase [Belnapia moabensis]|uniref:PaaI family thioesterase n=1 Tax=Belnapia moabensis TaxID=365533 RepID=UPI0005BA9EBF|nr:PaaI family thioesterase [Belnapia moabensis]
MDLATMLAVIRRGVPLAEDWGVELLEAEDGRAVLRLPASTRLLRPGDTLSGPALMGLADVAMWAALLSVNDGRDNSVTSTMTVNFLRPAGSGPVLAEARLVKRGRRMVFGEIMIHAEDSEEVAVHVTTTWAVIAPAAR